VSSWESEEIFILNYSSFPPSFPSSFIFHLSSFIIHPSPFTEAKQIRSLAAISTKMITTYERKSKEHSPDSLPLLLSPCKTPPSSPLCIDDLHENIWALQITHFTATLFARIPPHEFLGWRRRKRERKGEKGRERERKGKRE
jgi:hypothetical protein